MNQSNQDVNCVLFQYVTDEPGGWRQFGQLNYMKHPGVIFVQTPAKKKEKSDLIRIVKDENLKFHILTTKLASDSIFSSTINTVVELSELFYIKEGFINYLTDRSNDENPILISQVTDSLLRKLYSAQYELELREVINESILEDELKETRRELLDKPMDEKDIIIIGIFSNLENEQGFIKSEMLDLSFLK